MRKNKGFLAIVGIVFATLGVVFLFTDRATMGIAFLALGIVLAGVGMAGMRNKRQ
jgi:hypothetical protein